PMESDPDGWVMFSTFRDLPYDALTLLENVLDSSHIPYTHHQSVGNRKNAGPMVDLEILETGKPGFYATWPEGPRRGQLGQQFTTFVAPSLMWHDVTSEKFGRTLTVVYATPIRKGECRLFARFPFKFNSKLPSFLIGLSPRWYTHLRNNGVLEDDQIFLHLQERALAARDAESYGQACYMPSEGDRFVVEFRRWVRDYAADPFPNQPLPREWSQPDLLDRYHSHTQHCGSCRSALKRVQQLKRGSLIVGAIALCLYPVMSAIVATPSLLTGILYSLIPLTTGGLWLWLNSLEQQFFKGREIPPRNLPEK
ncbi:cell death suppressor protein Lls1, partial [filamentous cyanobacterium CCP5]